MTVEKLQRKIQFRQGSYVVTIPQKLVHMTGIQRDQYVTFAVSHDKIIIKPVDNTMTKKELAEANRDSAHLDDAGGDPRYMDELASALKRSGAESTGSSKNRVLDRSEGKTKPSPLERLAIK